MTRTRKQGGTVRRLTSGRWQALVDTGGRRVSIDSTFATEQEAHDALRKAVIESDSGTFHPKRAVPQFKDFASREVRLRDVRSRTKQGYESLLRTSLLPWFGNRSLDQITIGDLKVWWSIQSERPVNRRNAYFLLRSIMSAAVDERLIDLSPCRIKDAGKDAAEKRPTWSISDYRTVLTHVSDEVRPALEMLFSSHNRLGELIGLNASDYEQVTGIVHVTKQYSGWPTKTGQHKHIRLLQSGVDAMTTYLAASPRIGNAPLFTGPKGGRLPAATLRKAWSTACAVAGLENFHLHDLRHIGLTLCAQSGASLKDIQYRAGHASVQAAMRYQHNDAERDAEVAAMVDRRLRGPG